MAEQHQRAAALLGEMDANAIGFDGAMAGEYVTVAVRDRRAIAPFPQRTRAAAAAIDVANIAPAAPPV